MASAREVKKRIRSVKNISQITRALEAVSASRVRRAQARVLASRAFAEKAWEILLNVQNASKGAALHPLLTERTEIKKILIVLITSDRGLAGAFNTNIIRVAQRFAERMGAPATYITIGQKGRDAMIRARENVIAEFSNLSAEPTLADIAPATRLAIDEFLSGSVDDVFIAYTDFINMLTQRPTVLGWLPLIPHKIEDAVAAEYVKAIPSISQGNLVYEYEPSPAAILDEIVPRFTELQLYQAVLESQASEHAARMVSMRNASDNAAQLTTDLTLVYNKARQAGITAEILDIVGGAEALQASMNKSAAMIEDYFVADYVEEKPKRSKSPAAPVPAATIPGTRVLEQEAVAPSEQLPPASRQSKAVVAGDDLTRIEGIGSKMSNALKAAGIDTFAKLAEASLEQITAAIEAAGMRFAPSANTWAQQAALAVRGDWAGLEQFQSELSSGRKS